MAAGCTRVYATTALASFTTSCPPGLFPDQFAAELLRSLWLMTWRVWSGHVTRTECYAGALCLLAPRLVSFHQRRLLKLGCICHSVATR